MNLKKLNWRDNITDVGKDKGYFELRANVDELGLYYGIRNHMSGGEPSDKYYFFEVKNNFVSECEDIDDGKQKAQEHFGKTIEKLFYEEN